MGVGLKTVFLREHGLGEHGVAKWANAFSKTNNPFLMTGELLLVHVFITETKDAYVGGMVQVQRRLVQLLFLFLLAVTPPETLVAFDPEDGTKDREQGSFIVPEGDECTASRWTVEYEDGTLFYESQGDAFAWGVRVDERVARHVEAGVRNRVCAYKSVVYFQLSVSLRAGENLGVNLEWHREVDLLGQSRYVHSTKPNTSKQLERLRRFGSLIDHPLQT